MHFGVGVTSPYILNYYFMSLIINLMFTEDIFRLTHDITIKNIWFFLIKNVLLCANHRSANIK